MNITGKQWFILEPGNTSPVDGEFFETADALHQLMSAMDGVYAVYEFDAINPQKPKTLQTKRFTILACHPMRQEGIHKTTGTIMAIIFAINSKTGCLMGGLADGKTLMLL